jgi:hypothetical protein
MCPAYHYYHRILFEWDRLRDHFADGFVAAVSLTARWNGIVLVEQDG